MYIIVTIYCLGNNDEEKSRYFHTDETFMNIFDVKLGKSTDIALMGTISKLLLCVLKLSDKTKKCHKEI